MKTLTALACAAAAALTGWTATGDADAGPARDAQLSGVYVEARSASVFAGPCHVNGEYDLQGRQALLGFRIESGAWNGTDLAGVQVAATVGSSRNLAEGAPRSSTVWLDRDLPPARREAVLDWLRARHGAALGALDVAEASLSITVSGDRFALDVEGVARLAGGLLPDRACCTMPESVWYAPVVEVEDVVVGCNEVCQVQARPAWSYQRQNNVLVGRLAR